MTSGLPLFFVITVTAIKQVSFADAGGKEEGPTEGLLQYQMGFPGGAVIKNLPANVRDTGDVGLIPGLGRSPGGGSLQSKGLSRVFSNTTVQKHQFFGSQPSSQSNSHIHTLKLNSLPQQRFISHSD